MVRFRPPHSAFNFYLLFELPSGFPFLGVSHPMGSPMLLLIVCFFFFFFFFFFSFFFFPLFYSPDPLLGIVSPRAAPIGHPAEPVLAEPTWFCFFHNFFLTTPIISFTTLVHTLQSSCHIFLHNLPFPLPPF